MDTMAKGNEIENGVIVKLPDWSEILLTSGVMNKEQLNNLAVHLTSTGLSKLDCGFIFGVDLSKPIVLNS